MYVLYDTDEVHPFDRFEYARAGTASELAPVAIRGRAPGELHAKMSVARIGDFTVEVGSWCADSQLAVHRTERLIRASDPECYRVYVSVDGGVRMNQADNPLSFRPRDIGFYDVSRPWLTMHTTGRVPMRVVMLTFPRAVLPVADDSVRPLVGTLIPRKLAGRDLMAQFLIEVAEGHCAEPATAEALRECTIGLILQCLGRPHGFTPRIRHRLIVTRVHAAIRRLYRDPALDPARIAKAANISRRLLHQLFEGTATKPMQLVKQLRLEACHGALRDPDQNEKSIKDIAFANGYTRTDQFARDFKQRFEISPRQARASQRQPQA